MGYSPIRQFEALIPLFLRESRGRSPGATLGASAAATAYHVAYWISAGVGNQVYRFCRPHPSPDPSPDPTDLLHQVYFKLKQWQQLCMVMALLSAHLANLLFMAWCERQPIWPEPWPEPYSCPHPNPSANPSPHQVRAAARHAAQPAGSDLLHGHARRHDRRARHGRAQHLLT